MTITITNQAAILRVILTILVAAVAGSFLINGVIPLAFSTINRRRRGGKTSVSLRFEPAQARDLRTARHRIAIDHELTVTRVDADQFDRSYAGTCACEGWQRDDAITPSSVEAAHELHLDRLTYELIENGVTA